VIRTDRGAASVDFQELVKYVEMALTRAAGT
jgi:hypothetical protein